MSSHDDSDWTDLDTTIPKCGSYRAGCASSAGFQERNAATFYRSRAWQIELWHGWIATIPRPEPEPSNVFSLAAYRERREAEGRAFMDELAALGLDFDGIEIDLGDDDEPDEDRDELAEHVRAINGLGFAVTLTPLG